MFSTKNLIIRHSEELNLHCQKKSIEIDLIHIFKNIIFKYQVIWVQYDKFCLLVIKSKLNQSYDVWTN